MKINWSNPIHSDWRRVLGIFYIVFAVSAATLLFIEQNVLQTPAPAAAISAELVDSPVVHTTIASSPQVTQSSGKIHLSTATEADLETLPKIGPVKAAAISDYRNTHGLKVSTT